MPETKESHASIERARNAAIRWLEDRGVKFGAHRKVEIGSLGVSPLLGVEIGVAATKRPYWRLRLDWDPTKLGHFNAEFGRGATREKRAFCFPATEDQIRKMGQRRGTR